MNIRTKIISLLALLFAVLIVLEISIQKQVLMPSFAELEREDAEFRRMKLRQRSEVSGISREAWKAKQRRLVGAPRIIAIM